VSQTFFISDLHFGHRNIVKMSEGKRGGTDSESHDEWLIDKWNEVVKPKDIVYVLGDVVFGKGKNGLFHLTKVGFLNGRKHLVRGNHDELPDAWYLRYFESILGFAKYKNYWLSHAPVHPDELRGRINVHGHVHSNSIDDLRYFNVCVEVCPNNQPISLDVLRERSTMVCLAATTETGQ
jgi:calcineurin-like phosphoesterase family protein